MYDRYKNNDPRSAYALHILKCRHEYGNINNTMILLKLIKKPSLLLPYEQMYEGESNENMKYFLNIIYCAEVVQSCITFQHNLPHAQCKSSSAYKVHKFL